MKGLIEEIKKLGNIILVIDEVHSIVGAGDAEGSMNAANILKPALSRGEIQVIGATTLTEYRKYIEKDTALERRFQPVMVEEPSMEEATQILQGIAPYYEGYHHVVITPDICRLAVSMSERYITDRYLPDKAIDLIDEAASEVNLHNKDLARMAEIEKELADYAKEVDVVLAATGADNPQIHDLQQQEQKLQRQRDSLEMAISRDDNEAPNREDPAFQTRQEERRGQLQDLETKLSQVSAQKEQLQEEFFNTFNTLHNAGKQIILTSDKQPSDIPGLEARLVTRFQSGVTTQITAPTYETRLSILQHEQTEQLKLAPEILQYIAARVSSSIRTLKGALMRLVAYASMTRSPSVPMAVAEDLLADLLDKEAESRKVTIDGIQKTVAEHFGLRVTDLTGSKRPKNIAEPRMIAMYLSREMTDHSLVEIGSAFGGRNHATVLHALSQVEKLSKANEDTRRTISNLQRKIRG